jgi:uncharacterized protein YndB with AHSA1/START domain
MATTTKAKKRTTTRTARTKKSTRSGSSGGISEESVVAATGRTWAHWHRVLDAFGRADGRSHAEAAAHLEEAHRVPPWWAQMVTVEYERARGLRAVNERTKGFGVDVQRTIAVPAAKAFRAFADAGALSAWLGSKTEHVFRKGGRYSNAQGDRGAYLAIAAPRRIRMSWENPLRAPGSVVEVAFAPKGRGKTAVRVSHERLPDARSVAAMREGWSWALESLRTWLATGKGVRFSAWKAAGRPA